MVRMTSAVGGPAGGRSSGPSDYRRPMAEPLEVRASDADRERAAELLRRAAGDGRLTVDELDERLDDAFAARTLGELERLVADVTVAGGSPAIGAPAGGQDAPLPVIP